MPPSATKAASSPRGSPDKAAQGDASSSLPDFEDIADSAAELADTVSSLGSMFSEAFMLDTGASNSAKQQLTEKLGRFYMQHNPQKMQAPDAEKWLASVVDFYANKPGELNEQLKKQYGVGLDSMGSGAAPPPPAAAAAPASAASAAAAAQPAGSEGDGGSAKTGDASLEDEVDALLGEDDGLAVVDLN